MYLYVILKAPHRLRDQNFYTKFMAVGIKVLCLRQKSQDAYGGFQIGCFQKIGLQPSILRV